MKKIIAIFVSISSSVPLLVFAANPNCTQTGSGGLVCILAVVMAILNTVMPILITLGVVYFLWGVVQYVTSGDAEKKEEGQQHMIWGLIGVFVMVSVWGLVAVIGNTFGVQGNGGNPLGGGNVPCVIGTFDPLTGTCI